MWKSVICGLLLAAVTAAADPASVRLRKLLRQVAADRAAEGQFWSEVEKSGSPLVENADERGKSLVTFLWRGDSSTRNVVILGDGTPGAPADHQMAQLAGTNVWYRSYVYRGDARFRYALSVNDDLRPIESVPPAEFAQRMSTVVADPLNPPRGQNAGIPMSDLSLPGAPPQTFFVPRTNSPRGDVVARVFRSQILGNELKVQLYLPAGTRGKLPLVLFFDGQSYAGEMELPRTLDHLIAARRIRPVMAAMVDNAPGRRNADLTCNPEFARMLATELIPWLRSEFAVADEPVAVGGSSYGGLAAAFAALRYPEVFGAIVSQSGSYWWKPREATAWQWLVEQYGEAPVSGTRFYLEVGLMEIGTPGGRPSMLESNRRLREVLQKKGFAVKYSEFNGDHTPLNWRGSVADGLIWLFGAKP